MTHLVSTAARWTRRGLVLLLACALLALTPAAHADQRVIRDRVGDNIGQAGYGDLGRVVVRHTARTVRITAKAVRGGSVGDGLDVFLDTRARRRGPEFHVTWETYLGEWVGMGTVRGWGYDDYRRRRCRRLAVGGTIEAVTFTVPRRCLGRRRSAPARVRVNVQTVNFDGTRPRDHAPRRHRFGPWVRK